MYQKVKYKNQKEKASGLMLKKHMYKHISKAKLKIKGKRGFGGCFFLLHKLFPAEDCLHTSFWRLLKSGWTTGESWIAPKKTAWCQNGHLAVALLLVGMGAVVPLHIAAQNGHTKVAQLLVSAQTRLLHRPQPVDVSVLSVLCVHTTVWKPTGLIHTEETEFLLRKVLRHFCTGGWGSLGTQKIFLAPKSIFSLSHFFCQFV